MNGLDLFSGIGGIALALKPWVRTVSYCENNRFCQSVLLSRMWSGDLAYAPIWDDVRTLRGESFAQQIDLIAAGFPCQDLSVAGAGAGLGGSRSRIIFRDHSARWRASTQDSFSWKTSQLSLFGGLTEFSWNSMHWGMMRDGQLFQPQRWEPRTFADESGFLPTPTASGLREQRSRSEGRQAEISPFPSVDGAEESLADAQSLGSFAGRLPCGSQKKQPLSFVGSEYRGWNSQWATEPEVGRVAHGVSHRVDCLRELGNGVVHQTAQEAFMRLAGIGGVA
jgi:DNA (cytosine-5)-methyltransferase 1